MTFYCIYISSIIIKDLAPKNLAGKFIVEDHSLYGKKQGWEISRVSL